MTILVDVYKRALADKSLGHEKALARLSEHLNASLKNISGILLAECNIPPIASTMLANVECSAPTKAFLSQMISSHFHTGCTLVVGNDQTKVKKWVEVLSFFLLPKQHALASSTVAVGLKNFIADLSLQGLVVTEKIDDFDFVFESMFPTTIIDLNEMQVRQTHPYNSYNVIRTEYLKSPQDRNMWDGANERLFICKSSKVVEEIVHNVFSFPATSLFEREGYIRQAIELLIKKSVVLIKYFEALLKTMKDSESQGSGAPEHLTSSPGKNRNSSRNSSMSSMDDILKAAKNNELKLSSSIRRSEPAKGNRPESMSKITGSFSTGSLRGDDSARDNVPKIHGLESQVRNRVRESLGYTEADYQVLMGIAEKLLPGIYIKVHGNTRWIEEKLIELFEQF